MAHTISYNPESYFIELKVQGELTFIEAKEFVAEIVLLAKEKDCYLILSDYREAIIKLSTFEIYEMSKLILAANQSARQNAYKIKRVLIAARDLKDYSFFETVMANRGQSAKMFHDIDEAKKWLVGK